MTFINGHGLSSSETVQNNGTYVSLSKTELDQLQSSELVLKTWLKTSAVVVGCLAAGLLIGSGAEKALSLLDAPKTIAGAAKATTFVLSFVGGSYLWGLRLLSATADQERMVKSGVRPVDNAVGLPSVPATDPRRNNNSFPTSTL